MEDRFMKPITVERHEFVQNLTNLINSCNLPFFAIEDILKEFCKNVEQLSERQLQMDLKKYNDAISGKQQDAAADDGAS